MADRKSERWTQLVALTTILAAVAAGPRLARAEEAATAPAPSPPRLTLDLPVAAATTGGLLLLTGASVLWKSTLTPSTCRWCEPDQVDRWTRQQLRWHDVKSAGTASDALQLVVPAGAALALGLAARHAGAGTREVAEDLVAVAESASAALLLTQGAKFAAARRRPDAWASSAQGSADSRLSFWSGHTAFTFSVAAAATQVARLRGRPGWRWLALASFAGAATAGWLRMAADRHWLTDVATGALVGTATGLGVPLLVLRPEGAREQPIALAVAPGGLALRF